jgi:ribosomal protein S27E
MTGAWCITNDVADLRSCTITGEHRPWCDGLARKRDRQGRVLAILDTPCPGCLPRPAEVGRLCHDHLLKLEDAFGEVQALVVHLWSEPSNGIRDTNSRVSGGGGPSWTIPESRVHASWIVAAMRNAVEVLLSEPDDEPTIDLRRIDAGRGLDSSSTPAEVGTTLRQLRAALEVDRDKLIARARGAEAAVRFVQTVQAAVRKFPLRERRHRIVGLRCPECRHTRMMWEPPLAHLFDVVVKCDNCGAIRPQRWLERYAEVVELEPLEG